MLSVEQSNRKEKERERDTLAERGSGTGWQNGSQVRMRNRWQVPCTCL